MNSRDGDKAVGTGRVWTLTGLDGRTHGGVFYSTRLEQINSLRKGGRSTTPPLTHTTTSRLWAVKRTNHRDTQIADNRCVFVCCQ